MSEIKEAPGTLNASKLARSDTQFSDWAKHVNLDTSIQEDGLPETLQKLLDASKVVPSWVVKPDSAQYKNRNPKFQKFIDALQIRLPPEYGHCSDDVELAEDVSFVLDPIIRVCKRMADLRDTLPAPTESDRRTPMDQLMSSTWDDARRDIFQHRHECVLQLPRGPVLNSSRSPTQVQPDSSVFIKLDDWGLSDLYAHVSKACSSLIRLKTDDGCLRALQWVSEYKGDNAPEGVALRQAMIAIASGLYQRRALGFGSQFLFMTVHRPTIFLDVYAATWSSEKLTTVNIKTGTKSGSRKSHTKSSMGPPRPPSRDNMGDTGPSNPSPVSIKLEPMDVVQPSGPEYNKIVFYKLGNFNMSSCLEVLNLYLLMRAARTLAEAYKKEIDEGSRAKQQQQTRDFMEFYHWPAPPATTQGSDTSMRSSHRVTTPRETQEVSAPSQDNCSHDYQGFGPYEEPLHGSAMYVVNVEGTGSPLKFRQVEQLGSMYPDSKVRDYLVKSGPDIYEPLPDEHLDYD